MKTKVAVRVPHESFSPRTCYEGVCSNADVNGYSEYIIRLLGGLRHEPHARARSPEPFPAIENAASALRFGSSVIATHRDACYYVVFVYSCRKYLRNQVSNDLTNRHRHPSIYPCPPQV